MSEKLFNTKYRRINARDGVRTILRYANRKFYDTEIARYVTLKEVLELSERLERSKLVVLEHVSGRDITKKTLFHAAALISNYDVDSFVNIVKG